MRTRRFVPWLAVLLFSIAVVGSLDLAFDIAVGLPDTQLADHAEIHVIGELVFLLLCLATALYLGLGWHASQRSMAQLRANSQRARVFMEGLSKAIDLQLSAWGLSEGERTTALLMLKGMSHKEIAAATKRSESTVRQHAVEIYRKSGLSGRAELSAFFLEDLLLPNDVASDGRDGQEQESTGR